MGKFKDEMSSLLIKEFTALNPTVYSIIHHNMQDSVYHEDYNTKKLKGISKAVVKNNIKHEDYNTVLNTNISIKRDVVGIRSFQHQLYTYKQNKSKLPACSLKYEKLKSPCYSLI